MSYVELITKALKGRTVNRAAKDWHIPQSTLDLYARGKRLPDYQTAWTIAEEAGVPPEAVFRMLAEEEKSRKNKTLTEKISANFDLLVSRLNPRRSLIFAR